MRVFRGVHSDPPTLRDFESPWERGRRPPKFSPRAYHVYAGVSVFATLEQLRAKAKAYPLGDFAAEMEIEDHVSYDGPSPDGHIRLNGQSSGVLLDTVVAIHPMRPGESQAMSE